MYPARVRSETRVVLRGRSVTSSSSRHLEFFCTRRAGPTTQAPPNRRPRPQDLYCSNGGDPDTAKQASATTRPLLQQGRRPRHRDTGVRVPASTRPLLQQGRRHRHHQTGVRVHKTSTAGRVLTSSLTGRIPQTPF